jgi:hypothetical protein
MDSTAKPAPAGAEDPLLAHGDTKPNGDYERIVREELVRVQERLAQLAPVGAAAAAAPEVKVAPDAFTTNSSSPNELDANITAFRAADVNGVEGRSARPSRMRGVTRVLVALLLAGTVVGARAVWAAYGQTVISPIIASIEPQIGEMWSQVSERLGQSGERGAPPAQVTPAQVTPAQVTPAQVTPAQVATAETTAPPTTPPQVAAAQAAAPPQAAPPPQSTVSADVGQMLQGMAHDIASLQQGIEQLKAGQEQMARDNAKLAEQLKASQEQLTRVAARASEASIHPRPPLPASPKPPPVGAARRPSPPPPPLTTLPPPQAIAPPQAAASPAQLQAEDAGLPAAPRPPKPVP